MAIGEMHCRHNDAFMGTSGAGSQDRVGHGAPAGNQNTAPAPRR
jgi:hypothetical protein